MKKPKVFPATIALTDKSKREFLEVTVTFGDNSTMDSFRRWSAPKGNVAPDGKTRAADAIEFARLASKRWRHYRDTKTAAHDAVSLQKLTANNKHGEYCFQLVIRARWFRGLIAGAMIRRTWVHHFFLDFLFVHPAICAGLLPLRGAGSAMLFALCRLAVDLRVPLLWGEATHGSAAFYEAILGRTVSDHFFIRAPALRRCAAEFDRLIIPV